MFLRASELAKLAPVLTLVYLAFLFCALLYPFQFHPPDWHRPLLSFTRFNTEGYRYLVNNSDIMDVIFNIVFFIPFGVFLFAWLQRFVHGAIMAVSLTILGAGAFSMTCEVIQFFLPTRFSAIFDVISNVVGAAMGATGCWFWFLQSRGLRRIRKPNQ